MTGLVLWITGLPGSGKSTIADAISAVRPDFVLLRMDELRKVVTPNPTYSEAERDLVYRSIVYQAQILSSLGHNVIIDATGNLRRWRDFAREVIPRYVEVYLKCSLDACRMREEARKEFHGAPSAIYKKGKEGWLVPGLTVPYEEPLNPEITIDTEKMSSVDALSLILDLIEQK
ncbi:MAG TPA: adenylyl-sulfate kinase [Dissulfurispiraceae bacterium]|nr:adenylyl-sulfate kinase [Dissulfurispiraceae bacterium]